MEKEAEKLDQALTAANMKLLSRRGAITYSRSSQVDQNCSTIDLTFGGDIIVGRDPQWDIVDAIGFESDHRVTQISLDIKPSRLTSTRFNWKRANKKHVSKAVKTALKSLGNPVLASTAEVDKYATDMVSLLCAAMSKTVPLVKPRALRPDLKGLANVRSAFDDAQNALEMSNSESASERGHTSARYQTLRLRAKKRLAHAKRQSFRFFVAKGSKDSRRLFRTARLGKRMCHPKAPPHLKNIIVGDVIYDTSEGMRKVFEDHLWSDTDDAEAASLPQPHLDPQREQYTSPQELTGGEVAQLIRKIKSGKAAGVDEVGNDLLKMSKDVVTPYLEHLFRACISLGYEPDQFKMAKTVLLKKPDKETYTLPNSWRPIALLSSIGKLLEAIIAHRLRDLDTEHNLLPTMQFGTGGKCTTKALVTLLDRVYSAWCNKLQATLLSLGIKGAYDRVDRGKLLDTLANLKIPDWIIRFVWSFLSNRSTTLEMPGHSSQGPFFVNVGIPQGSTLSPILFLFFASPILTRLSSSHLLAPNCVALAYVDDTYLLAVSKSHEDNCRILEYAHGVIIDWANESGVTFEPKKYAVVHFLDPNTRKGLGSSNLSKFKALRPQIRGLTVASVKSILRILGVIVDYRLSWKSHVEHVSIMINRILKRINNFRSKRRYGKR